VEKKWDGDMGGVVQNDFGGPSKVGYEKESLGNIWVLIQK